ncbi:MAG: hypothetical protein ABF812_09410 [Gluconobacter cerinus]|uniref:hypothetical protein n=1 Tax=Gluconobacter cerinus TaxID=38307 RepID=UPI0039EA8020
MNTKIEPRGESPRMAMGKSCPRIIAQINAMLGKDALGRPTEVGFALSDDGQLFRPGISQEEWGNRELLSALPQGGVR